MKFAKGGIAKLELPASKKDLIIFDEALPGFGVRLRAGGKRTWIVQYRTGRATRRFTIGTLAEFDLDQARDEAKTILARVRLGEDPQAAKERGRIDSTVTLATIIPSYLAAKRPRLRPRSYLETERHLRKGWAALHQKPVADIDRADVAAGLTAMTAERGAVAADRARAALSALYSWAMREGIVDANPVANTNRPAEPRARERVLSDDELVEILNACRDDDYGRIVRLLILTGQRRSEVGGMERSEIDASNAMWLLPAERAKNGRPNQVPLSKQALSVIDEIPVRANRTLLFGEGKGSFSGWSKAKAALDGRILAARRQRADDGAQVKLMDPWRLQDLRRTVATRMADLGVAPHVVEAILNHVSGTKASVAGIYNRAIYAPEKREAVDMWGSHVEALLSGWKSEINRRGA